MFAVGFRPHRLIVLSSMLLAGSSYPAVEEYFQQNLAAIVLLFLAAAAASAVHHRLALSGFLLALSTSKPDTTGLIVLWFLLWALAKWKERGRLIWSFAGTLLVLECASEAISPHWISHFLAAVWKYPTYGTDPSVLGALFPRWLALLATAALVLWFLMVCWKWRQSPANSKCFGWAIAWAGVVTLTVIPKLAAYNQLLLIPVLLILVGQMNGSAFLRRMLARAAFACQGWQWLTAVLLATGSFVVPWDRLRTVALIPLYTLLALPLLALLAVIASTCRCPPSATRDLSR
jgi:hypothetical protein